MAQKFLTDIEVTRGLVDSSGDLGVAGQVLSSTGSGTNWITNEANSTVVYLDEFTGDNSTVDFTISVSVTDENITQVYIDGVYQNKDTYSVSGTTLTFSTAPPLNADIEVITFSTATTSDDLAAGSVIIPVKNTHTASIAKGEPVYITGNVGSSARLEIAPADASNSAKMPAAGLLLQTLAVNAEGYVITGGYLRNITTDTIDGTSTSSNDTVYVKSGGGLTMTKPTGTNLIQNIAKVARVASGSAGSLLVSSILRTNDVPNITNDYFWLGNSSGVATPTEFTSTARGLLSVGAEGTAAGDGNLAYNNSSGVFTYTPPVLGGLSGTTDNITEGSTNLYYTDARSRSSISAGGDLSYNSTTGVMSYTTPTTIASLSNHDTDDLVEGATNLYYTDTRVGTYLTNNSYATQSYVNTQVSNLVDSAPSTLDTLNELAAALGDDANFSTTVTNSIATKLPLAGGTLTGALQAQSWLFRSMSGQVEYHVLNNGNINGPSWKFRYDGATANRWVDFGYKDGNGTYYEGLKLYNNSTISWKGTDIINASSQWVGGIASSGYNNTNWDTAYTYSQVGHLPLAGGTLTGGLNGTTATFSGAGTFTSDSTTARVLYLEAGSSNGNIIQFQRSSVNKWELVGREGTFYIYKNDGNGSGMKWQIDTNGNHTITGVANFVNNVTFSSNAIITGSGTANAASLQIDNPDSNSFNHSIEAFAANLTNGESNIIVVGKEGNTKNSGYLGYYWTASGSNNNFVSLGHWGANHLFRVYGDQVLSTVTLRGDVDMQAPYFYHKGNTSYYLSPGNGTNGISANLQGRIQVGTFSQSQANTGEAWIGRAADRAQGTLTVQLGTNTGRKFEVVDYSWTTVEFSANDSGTAFAASDFRAPEFYDSNDTAYYINPNSSSKLSGLKLEPASGTNQASGDDNVLWIHRVNNNDWGIQVNADQGSATDYGFEFLGGSSHTYAFSGVAAGNRYFNVGSSYAQHSGSFRSPIFYDSDNTSYYLDPNTTGTSLNVAGKINASNFNGTNFKYLGTGVSYDTNRTTKVDDGIAIYGAYSGGSNSPHTYDMSMQVVGNSRGFELSAAWHSQTSLAIRTLRDCCQNWSSWYTVALHGLNNSTSALYAGLYYDANNTSYYVDPGNGSNLNGNTRITNTRFGVSTTGTFNFSTGYGFHTIENGSSNEPVCMFYHQVATTSTQQYGINIISAANHNNTTSRFMLGQGGSSEKIKIYSNGNIQNQNNSYGQLSDINLKENIVDATSKLDDINQVRVVNFNYIGDVDEETNIPNKQIGVVAQELEEIFPGIVYECGDTETPTKAVKYSVFVPMLIKAVQELTQEVQTLKDQINGIN